MAEGIRNDETLKALVEAIVYVSPEPVTLDVLAKALRPDKRERVQTALRSLVEDYSRAEHGIQIRPVAGGWKFSSKPEHHEILRDFVKSLTPPLRLSKPSLEVLAVIAYRQPITVPEINEIRGVDCGGVIHTLLERKLIVTAGRKNVAGRPILYRAAREFLLHFGLKDVGELPSLREFEDMARQALGPEFLPPEELASGSVALGDSEEHAGSTSDVGDEAEPGSVDEESDAARDDEAGGDPGPIAERARAGDADD